MSNQPYIKRLKSLGWSQDDIAQLLDVTRPTVKKMLIGEPTKISKASQKLLVVISKQNMTIGEMRVKALQEYIERHFLKETYLELAREIDDILTPPLNQTKDEREQ